MTALQSILKEAKSLRKSFPKRYSKWTDYVKQASAIYASKHKGKSPVGKKKSAKKRISGSSDYYTRKKEGRVIPRKTKHKKSAKKKPSEQSILNKIHTVKHDVERLDEAQHKHMMGTIKKNFKNFILYKKHIIDVIVRPNGNKMYYASVHPLGMPFATSQLSIAKKWIDKHIAKKRIKSNK
jgi:hypothetical protein